MDAAYLLLATLGLVCAPPFTALLRGSRRYTGHCYYTACAFSADTKQLHCAFGSTVALKKSILHFHARSYYSRITPLVLHSVRQVDSLLRLLCYATSSHAANGSPRCKHTLRSLGPAMRKNHTTLRRSPLFHFRLTGVTVRAVARFAVAVHCSLKLFH